MKKLETIIVNYQLYINAYKVLISPQKQLTIQNNKSRNTFQPVDILTNSLELNLIFRKICKFYLNLSSAKTTIMLLTSFHKLFFPNKKLDYFLSRDKDIESLLFFYPLTFFDQSSKKLRWLNVGAGIHNYYDRLPSNIEIISLEQSLFNIFLSRFLFDSPHAAFICADITISKLFTKKFDIVTTIDSLPFMKDQQKAIKHMSQLTKKNGVFYASAIIAKKHKYMSASTHLLPKSTFKKYWPSLTPIRFVDERNLLSKINHLILNQYKFTSNVPKYGVIATKRKNARSLSKVLSSVGMVVNY
jgi:hypothetical protein